MFILYESIIEFNIIAVILSLLSFLFFISIFIYSIYIFTTDKPAIIITDDGITDNSNMFGVGFVSWKLIKHSALIDRPNYIWLSLSMSFCNCDAKVLQDEIQKHI